MLITGEVDRVTGFEKGFPVHQAWRGQSWEPDPLILDDQALIIHVAGRGLLVLTGCGHAGIVNIVRHAQRLTGKPLYTPQLVIDGRAAADNHRVIAASVAQSCLRRHYPDQVRRSEARSLPLSPCGLPCSEIVSDSSPYISARAGWPAGRRRCLRTDFDPRVERGIAAACHSLATGDLAAPPDAADLA